MKKCSVEGCGRPFNGRGLCKHHYDKMRHAFAGVLVRPKKPPGERFVYFIKKTEGCWVWMGAQNDNGYGRFDRTYAHRFSYEFFSGKKIPPKYQIDHLCKNIICVNPRHLEAVPPVINNQRSDSLSAKNGRKTHCKQGHVFDVKNTLILSNGRSCRTCNRDRARERYRRKSRENSESRR